MKTGMRHQAREAALQLLYQEELNPMRLPEAFGLFWKEHSLADAARAFVEELVLGVAKHREQIDHYITEAATHWRLDRMSYVDRAILRLAVYEMLYCEDIPRPVSLDEAVELAKKFGSEESSSFINGVLDRIANYDSTTSV